MNIHITTQYRENYGTESAPYWKFKGGTTYVVTGFNHPLTSGIGEAAAAAVKAMAPRIEYANPMAEEYIIDWSLEPADALTEWESDQLRFDGSITSPSERMAL